jgi:hypothetical protein
LKAIGDWTCSDSRIKIIGIPNNVENIGEFCFSKCEYLCGVVFESDSKSNIGVCCYWVPHGLLLLL